MEVLELPLMVDYFLNTSPAFLKDMGVEVRKLPSNKTLVKLGFEFIRKYKTRPGWINFEQEVNRYELKKENLLLL